MVVGIPSLTGHLAEGLRLVYLSLLHSSIIARTFAQGMMLGAKGAGQEVGVFRQMSGREFQGALTFRFLGDVVHMLELREMLITCYHRGAMHPRSRIDNGVR